MKYLKWVIINLLATVAYYSYRYAFEREPQGFNFGFEHHTFYFLLHWLLSLLIYLPVTLFFLFNKLRLWICILVFLSNILIGYFLLEKIFLGPKEALLFCAFYTPFNIILLLLVYRRAKNK